MQRNSNNSWVMVTGGTGGIGKALIARLAARGQNVVASAREPDRISTALGPGRVVGVQLDMERPETTSVAAREVARIVGGGGLSGLVNMAGVIVEGPLETISPAELRRQLEINVVGPFALTQALLPLLKRARGRVVNIGAISAHLTVPFYGPVAASKSALASLNDAMRLIQGGCEVVAGDARAGGARYRRTGTAFQGRRLERSYLKMARRPAGRKHRRGARARAENCAA